MFLFCFVSASQNRNKYRIFFFGFIFISVFLCLLIVTQYFNDLLCARTRTEKCRWVLKTIYLCRMCTHDTKTSIDLLFDIFVYCFLFTFLNCRCFLSKYKHEQATKIDDFANNVNEWKKNFLKLTNFYMKPIREFLF